MNVDTIAPTSSSRTVGPTAGSGTGADFAAALDTAMADGGSATPDDPVTTAQAAIAAFDLTRSATDPSAAATYAEGARQVSIVQALPDGSVDFTRITPRQMMIVGGAMIAGGTASAPALAGVLDLAGQDQTSTTPVNYFAYLRHEAAENEQRPGGMTTAFQQQTSAAVLKRRQREADVPVTYDDNYPTAPHDPTPEEINTKLKAAIAAFEKESSLTPAQRIRRAVLHDMKITEESLKAMPPAEREAAEKTIGDEVLRRLKLLGLSETGSAGSGAGAADTAGADPVATSAADDTPLSLRTRDGDGSGSSIGSL